MGPGFPGSWAAGNRARMGRRSQSSPGGGAHGRVVDRPVSRVGHVHPGAGAVLPGRRHRSLGERHGESTDVRMMSKVSHAMPWWISLLFLAISVSLWMSGRNNPDDVIGLLERLLAGLLIFVVVLVSQN